MTGFAAAPESRRPDMPEPIGDPRLTEIFVDVSACA
jgi:hypothetical protein